MSPSDLEEMIRELPFKPLRFTMNSGDQFVLTDPRYIVVTGTSAYLGIDVDDETGIPRVGKLLSMINICSVERIDAGQIRHRRRPRR